MEQYQDIKFNCNAKSGKTHSSPLNINNRLAEKQKQLEEVFQETGEKFVRFERNKYGQLCVVYIDSLFENSPEKCVRVDSVLNRKLKEDNYRNKFIQNSYHVIGLTTEIHISNSKQIVLIDTEDVHFVKSVVWHINNTGYVVGQYCEKPITLNRFIIQHYYNAIKIETVDHKDRNTLNNRKENLRTTTYSQNNINRKSKNYSYQTRDNNWQVFITLECKVTYAGSYRTEKEAHQVAYNLRRQYYKEFAWDWDLSCEESWVELHKN